MTETFPATQARFRVWMVQDALPVWATVGRDRPGLGFHEQMTLEGEPACVPFKRLRVQARQIYVFSHAHLLGCHDGMEAALDAYRFIRRHALRDDGAWVRTLGRDGGVLDPAADLYDLAFVLFALAWLARATGDREPLVLARRTAEWIGSNMAAAAGGFHNVLPLEQGHRQQNPHMHLLEASLALLEASGDAFYAELCQTLLTLFLTRFHHAPTRCVGEFFDERLHPVPGEAGDHVEPGHLYEWTWLLDQCRRALGGPPVAEMAGIYAFAEAHGRMPPSPAILDVVGRDGRIRRASSRLWPQTEALKAHAAMAAHGIDTSARLQAGLAHMLDRHLSDCPRGMWRDHFGADGQPIADKIPASSLYHVFMAFAELERRLRPALGV